MESFQMLPALQPIAFIAACPASSELADLGSFSTLFRFVPPLKMASLDIKIIEVEVDGGRIHIT
jgi:hypothetical protein